MLEYFYEYFYIEYSKCIISHWCFVTWAEELTDKRLALGPFIDWESSQKIKHCNSFMQN